MKSVVFPLFVCLAFSLGACSKKSEAKWPEKPADGTPVVLEFIEMTGSGDKLAANMEIFNFSDKAVKSFSARLHYLDAGGKELKTFPWSQTSAGLVDGKDHETLDRLGAFMPPETKSVKATVRRVEFADGSKWQSGN